VTTSTLQTLADYSLSFVRCSGCCDELPKSAKVELFANAVSKWLVIECPRCNRFTPHKLEEGA
jgi:hypothetical protein